VSRCSLIHLQRTSPTCRSFNPAPRTTSQQPNPSAVDVPSSMEVPPPDRQDTDGSANGPATRKQWDSESGRKAPPPDHLIIDGSVSGPATRKQ
jgi:hypothetical protein